MSILDPAQMSGAFVEAFNAGDVESLLALYEPDAVYIHGDQEITDSAALAEVFKQLTAVRPKMELINEYCLVCDDTALVRARWKLQWRDATKQTHIKQGHSSEVLRRGIDGAWRYVIDHPVGGD
jgi:ketosteroid isomerase-like protein